MFLVKKHLSQVQGPSQAPVSVRPDRDRARWGKWALVVTVFLVAGWLAEPMLWDPLRAEYYLWELDSAQGREVQAILNKLSALGPVGDGVLLRALDDSDSYLRRRAVEYLYRHRAEDPRTEALLLASLHDPEHRVWTMAEGALLGLWSKSANEAANRLYLKGIASQMKGRWEESMPWFEQAYGLDSQFAMCQHQIGHSLEMMGQWDKAIEAYEKAVSAKPQHFEALYRLAALYEARGDRQKANECLVKARLVFPHPGGDSPLVEAPSAVSESLSSS